MNDRHAQAIEVLQSEAFSCERAATDCDGSVRDGLLALAKSIREAIAVLERDGDAREGGP